MNEIQFSDDKCLDAPNSEPGSFVEMITCHGLRGNQEWKHDKRKVKLVYGFKLEEQKHKQNEEEK